MSSSSKTPDVKPQSILYAKFDYNIPERSGRSDDYFASFDFNTMEIKDNTGLNDILNNIRRAATDPNISGIYLDLSSIGTSLANVEEIRNRLLEFKKSGKFIISYSEGYGQSAYYLASLSDKIYLNPQGSLDLRGMASQVMFYKHLLEKLEIEMQIVRGPDNKFKSAVEPYFLDKMSAANREQMEKLLNSMWGTMLASISESRDITIDKINALVDDLDIVFDAEKVLENGFVDGLYYEDMVLAELRQRTGLAEDAKIKFVTNANYAKLSKDNSGSAKAGKVAVIYAVGQIIDGKGNETTIGSETLSKAIREARTDKRVKAIVMRVNSPGGSALASDVIGREVKLAAAAKPFVVSMGGYAASGGYWISSQAHHIFADKSTLTGSIGVFGTFPNMKRFFNNKLGLTFDVAKTNANSDFGSMAEPLTDVQYKKLQNYVAKTYSEFLDLVSTSRGLRKTYVDSIGQGRVWSGADALELGLVDEIGGLEQAIECAAGLAELGENYRVVELPKQKSIFETIMENETDGITEKVMREKLGTSYEYINDLKTLSELEGVQARVPFVMSIN